MRGKLCVLVLFASLASAQTVEAPKISDAAHARIRDIQWQEEALKNRYAQLDQALAAEVDFAYKEANLKREDYTFDLTTLTFARIAKPAPQPAKKP